MSSQLHRQIAPLKTGQVKRLRPRSRSIISTSSDGGGGMVLSCVAWDLCRNWIVAAALAIIAFFWLRPKITISSYVDELGKDAVITADAMESSNDAATRMINARLYACKMIEVAEAFTAGEVPYNAVHGVLKWIKDQTPADVQPRDGGHIVFKWTDQPVWTNQASTSWLGQFAQGIQLDLPIWKPQQRSENCVQMHRRGRPE
ncbi:uncharacterized protein MYCGRDRAFT_97818 [Zymoseptoria tritici IPO323]|uniref:Uncharacterized protein n=1 Tax=Zymoseptoria tritici (strain CBS 115943 / IPO323) TaxID=336722 RepID=F9XRG8_ZYMTI|nr:uncharacterized protein MYCGRDRAFT_97818 [Zymoseptoria tritici IPO323]EGP82169.1 hypothetical protein MYCGRDRAFT_97818 [Zymoseptoria tritici IPO323]